MGIRNYLIDGVSCSGKTTVATALARRGHHVIHGDRVLARRGDPKTGAPLDKAQERDDPAWRHAHHIWPLDRVAALCTDSAHPVTFFCGGARNSHQFLALFDRIFVLALDRQTLIDRLATRPADEFGATPAERALILRLHETGEDLPAGATLVDATLPLAQVVDAILQGCRLET
ncbi:nucleoside kinase [Rhizobium rhizosphaerae]|uniref:Nucleoside kinase n=1 Tax=Xaviernesmea rhizosphaerae TaxID=1672749 RepID=A0ABX3P8R2_9HYPH|nr:AAA family ATPase [Xaviernesmea rhizosphaerae]OQP83904.1 nucleoside kinase [Xaviernesmea rhizosphaerae]